MSEISMVPQSPVGSAVLFMAMNQGRAPVQIHQMSPAQRMPDLISIKSIFGQKMTGLGLMLDLYS